jgi:hypothetical protein
MVIFSSVSPGCANWNLYDISSHVFFEAVSPVTFVVTIFIYFSRRCHLKFLWQQLSSVFLEDVSFIFKLKIYSTKTSLVWGMMLTVGSDHLHCLTLLCCHTCFLLLLSVRGSFVILLWPFLCFVNCFYFTQSLLYYHCRKLCATTVTIYYPHSILHAVLISYCNLVCTIIVICNLVSLFTILNCSSILQKPRSSDHPENTWSFDHLNLRVI